MYLKVNKGSLKDILVDFYKSQVEIPKTDDSKSNLIKKTVEILSLEEISEYLDNYDAAGRLKACAVYFGNTYVTRLAYLAVACLIYVKDKQDLIDIVTRLDIQHPDELS